MNWLAEKSIETWVALMGGLLFALRRNAGKGRIARSIDAGISGAIGISLTPDVMAMTGRSEPLVMFALTAFGFLALDTLSILVADSEFVKRLIERRLGGRD